MTTIMPTTQKIHEIPVDTFNTEILAMTIGHHGKNFIKWTESTPGITKIWHNKTSNMIEITGDSTDESTYSKVAQIISSVLEFNSTIVKERETKK